MRYLAIAATAVLLIMAAAGTTEAGFYHFADQLLCPDCHTMHASQQHGYNPDGTGFFNPVDATPHEFLLRNEINDLCLSCHDNQTFAPDVFEQDISSGVRQAGALNEVGGNAQYPPPTGHTLGETATAPGGTFAPDPLLGGLNCADCHSAHGRGGNNVLGAVADPYRNLRVGGNTLSYAANANDTTMDVFVQTGAVLKDKYQVPSVWFNEPDTTNSSMAVVCKGCHTDFHGAVGGAEIGGTGSPPEEFIRHPAAAANIGQLGGGHSSAARFAGRAPNQVKVMDPAGQTGNWTDATNQTLTPTCISCHKGHGNQNAFGLIYMLGTDAGGGAITEQGDGGAGVRQLCRQCHVQGGDATLP